MTITQFIQTQKYFRHNISKQERKKHSLKGIPVQILKVICHRK